MLICPLVKTCMSNIDLEDIYFGQSQNNSHIFLQPDPNFYLESCHPAVYMFLMYLTLVLVTLLGLQLDFLSHNPPSPQQGWICQSEFKSEHITQVRLVKNLSSIFIFYLLEKAFSFKIVKPIVKEPIAIKLSLEENQQKIKPQKEWVIAESPVILGVEFGLISSEFQRTSYTGLHLNYTYCIAMLLSIYIFAQIYFIRSFQLI